MQQGFIATFAVLTLLCLANIARSQTLGHTLPDGGFITIGERRSGSSLAYSTPPHWSNNRWVYYVVDPYAWGAEIHRTDKKGQKLPFPFG